MSGTGASGERMAGVGITKLAVEEVFSEVASASCEFLGADDVFII